MASPNSPSSTGPLPVIRLDGWKEIASPFGDRDHRQLWPVLVYDGTRFVPVSGAITR